MVEYPVLVTIIANNFSSNPRPNMVVKILVAPIHLKEKCQDR